MEKKKKEIEIKDENKTKPNQTKGKNNKPEMVLIGRTYSYLEVHTGSYRYF